MPDYNRVPRWLGAAVVAAALGMGPHHAHAAAFQLRENSTVDLGTVFAGAASAADTASTVFNNPAGMMELPGLQTSFGTTFFAPDFTFHGQATNAFGQPIGGRDVANGGHDAMVPFNALSWRINDRVALGIAITTPFGLTTYYGPGFVGRYQGDKSTLVTFDVNPNVAVRVTDWLALGAGFSAQRATVEFNTAINAQTLGYAATGALLPLPDGLLRLRAAGDWAFGYNVGALFTPLPGTRIGLVYRSRVQHDFSSTAQFIVPAPLSLSPALASSPGSAKFVLPDTASASVTQVITPRVTLYGDVSWTNWSLDKSLNVYRSTGQLVAASPENYRDSVFVSAGARYALTPSITLRGGIGFDETPTTDADRSPRVPDADRYLIAIGGSYQVTRLVAVDLAYSHVFVGGTRVDQASATGDVLDGDYDSHVDVLSVGMHSAF